MQFPPPPNPLQTSAPESPPRSRLPRRVAALAVCVTYVVCAVAHFSTPFATGHHSWHSVHYLVFFIPIVLASLTFGRPAGLAMAVLAAATYFPYSFRHSDPGSVAGLTQALLEMGLYLIVGTTMGWLADRERGERKRVEAANEELRARTAQLVAAERRFSQMERLSALGRLAATIAHEVRNPLGSIKGSAEILRDDFPKDHPKHKFLDILVNEANRLNLVLDNFLEFARPPALSLSAVSPGQILHHVSALVGPQCRRDGIRLTVDCDMECLQVAGDERQLQQGLLNVVLNAIEAMPAGGALTLRCIESLGAEASGVQILVEDTGPGLTDEQLANAFEPFYSAKANGTGLGLTTVRKIVEAHGGSIILANRSDAPPGAVVAITLPAAAPAAAATAPQEVKHVAP